MLSISSNREERVALVMRLRQKRTPQNGEKVTRKHDRIAGRWEKDVKQILNDVWSESTGRKKTEYNG